MRPRAAAVRRAGTLASTAVETRRAARRADTLARAEPRDETERTQAQQDANLLRLETGNVQADAHARRDTAPELDRAFRHVPANPQAASATELAEGLAQADVAVQAQVEQAPPIVAELARSGLSPEEIRTQTGVLANFVGLGEILEEIQENPEALRSPAVLAEIAELQQANRQLLPADTPGLTADDVRAGRSGLTAIAQGEVADPAAALDAMRAVQQVLGAAMRHAGLDPEALAERFVTGPRETAEAAAAPQEERGGVFGAIGKGFDAAKEFAGDAVDGAKELAADTVEAFETGAQHAERNARELGTKAFNAADEFVDDIGDELRERKRRFELGVRGVGGQAFNDVEVKLDELETTVQQAELGMRNVIIAGANATDSAVDEALDQLDVLQRKADAALAEGQMSAAQALYDAKLRLEMAYLVQKGELLNTPEAMFQWVYDNTPEAIKKWHFEDRHALNTDLPSFEEADRDPQWTKVPDWMNKFHQDGIGKREVKYVHKDGREVIFNGDTQEIVRDERIFGTFNRVVPDVPPENPLDVQGWVKWLDTGAQHYLLDIVPYALLGNARPRDARGKPIP